MYKRNRKKTSNLIFLLYSFHQLDRTPLHWACAKGHLAIVELLVEMGADLEAKDKVCLKNDIKKLLPVYIEIKQSIANYLRDSNLVFLILYACII